MDAEDLFDVRTLPPGDDGMTQMVVFPNARTKKVIQRFARPMLFVAYEPQNLVAVAGQMLDCCEALGFKVSVKVEKRKITEQQRAVLITRVGHILKTQIAQNRPQAHIARSVVDIILSAVD
jgi:hypothetical protein